MSVRILAIDTTTEACSAALLHEGVIQERYQLAPRQHTHLLLPMLEALLHEAALKPKDLDALALCRGPGSFVGCRIGASVVQAISFGADIPVILISSLQCLAQGAYREFQADRVLAAIDARMQQVYWGRYQLDAEGSMVVLDAEQLSAPIQVQVADALPFIGVGSGWDNYSQLLVGQFKNQLQHYYPQRYPRAYDVASLAQQAYQQGKLVSAQEALPVYLRKEVI
jgi:tRNA threonylcarbamoyladenosine biosynthesis protein TsaB